MKKILFVDLDGTLLNDEKEISQENREAIEKRLGEPLCLKYILDVRDLSASPYADKVVGDFSVLENDPDLDVVVESIGGAKVALDFPRRALLAGKHVVTSNKELVATHGRELLAIAREKNVNYLFEASVGGGIPLLRPIFQCLAGNEIEEISGILNGTTNFILTKMEKEGADFAATLKKAQEKGYAERNPEADIQGYDACRKIAILSSLMTGQNVSYQNIYTEGITGITADDFVYARALGRSIKLLAMSKDTPEGTLAMVAPCMIGPENPLYMVSGVFNAVCVRGNMLGDSMYYGKGAGKLPTASAVVSDVVDCARHQGKTILCFWNQEEARLVEIGDVERGFFLRAAADAAEKAFPGAERIRVEGRTQDCGYLIPPMKEKEFASRYEALGEKALGRIRLE